MLKIFHLSGVILATVAVTGKLKQCVCAGSRCVALSLAMSLHTQQRQVSPLHQRDFKAIRLFQRRPWPVIDKIRHLMDFRRENMSHKRCLFVFPGISKMTFSTWDKYTRRTYGRVMVQHCFLHLALPSARSVLINIHSRSQSFPCSTCIHTCLSKEQH